MIDDKIEKTSLCIVLLLICSSLYPAGGQTKPQGRVSDQEPAIRLQTSLVTIPVSVSDRSGRFITGLESKDFAIFENGVRQETAYFETSDRPFTVAILVDTSDSTWVRHEDILQSAAGFAGRLRPGDKVMVVSFDRNVTVLTEPTEDRDFASTVILNIRQGGGTSLYQAVESTIEGHLRRIPGRKAIVVFSDGVDTTSTGATYSSSLAKAEEFDGLIYSIQFNTRDDSTLNSANAAGASRNAVTPGGEPLSVAYQRAGQYLSLLATNSGGRFHTADSAKSLSRAFALIAEELSRQYSIGYYPADTAPDGKTRRIKVTVSSPGAVVRARKSYVFRERR